MQNENGITDDDKIRDSPRMFAEMRGIFEYQNWCEDILDVLVMFNPHI